MEVRTRRTAVWRKLFLGPAEYYIARRFGSKIGRAYAYAVSPIATLAVVTAGIVLGYFMFTTSRSLGVFIWFLTIVVIVIEFRAFRWMQAEISRVEAGESYNTPFERTR